MLKDSLLIKTLKHQGYTNEVDETANDAAETTTMTVAGTAAVESDTVNAVTVAEKRKTLINHRVAIPYFPSIKAAGGIRIRKMHS